MPQPGPGPAKGNLPDLPQALLCGELPHVLPNLLNPCRRIRLLPGGRGVLPLISSRGDAIGLSAAGGRAPGPGTVGLWATSQGAATWWSGVEARGERAAAISGSGTTGGGAPVRVKHAPRETHSWEAMPSSREDGGSPAASVTSVRIGLPGGEGEARGSTPGGSAATPTTKSTSADSVPPAAADTGGAAAWRAAGADGSGGSTACWTAESSPGRGANGGGVAGRGEDLAATALVPTSNKAGKSHAGAGAPTAAGSARGGAAGDGAPTASGSGGAGDDWVSTGLPGADGGCGWSAPPPPRVAGTVEPHRWSSG